MPTTGTLMATGPGSPRVVLMAAERVWVRQKMEAKVAVSVPHVPVRVIVPPKQARG